MVACWVVGLAWIVTYYINPDLKYLRDLGDWNLLVGMGLIAVGFVLSTKWEFRSRSSAGRRPYLHACSSAQELSPVWRTRPPTS